MYPRSTYKNINYTTAPFTRFLLPPTAHAPRFLTPPLSPSNSHGPFRLIPRMRQPSPFGPRRENQSRRKKSYPRKGQVGCLSRERDACALWTPAHSSAVVFKNTPSQSSSNRRPGCARACVCVWCGVSVIPPLLRLRGSRRLGPFQDGHGDVGPNLLSGKARLGARPLRRMRVGAGELEAGPGLAPAMAAVMAALWVGAAGP